MSDVDKPEQCCHCGGAMLPGVQLMCRKGDPNDTQYSVAEIPAAQPEKKCAECGAIPCMCKSLMALSLDAKAEHEAKFADRIRTTVYVHLSLWDRLRLLLVGRMMVRIEVDTEHEVGATVTRSFGWVPLLWRSRHDAITETEGREAKT